MNEEKEISEHNALPPRKKGLLRMIELLDRDGSKFFKAGALAILSMAPFFLVIAFALALAAFIYCAYREKQQGKKTHKTT